jgi:acyl dehydratase
LSTSESVRTQSAGEEHTAPVVHGLQVLAFTAPGATLEIIDLASHGDAGQVTTRATVHNQHGQLVLDGEHTYLLKTAHQGTSETTS